MKNACHHDLNADGSLICYLLLDFREAEKTPAEAKKMRTFAESGKSQKTVNSMIMDKNKKNNQTENVSKPTTKGSPKVVKENGELLKSI